MESSRPQGGILMNTPIPDPESGPPAQVREQSAPERFVRQHAWGIALVGPVLAIEILSHVLPMTAGTSLVLTLGWAIAWFLALGVACAISVRRQQVAAAKR